jgi:hypothetical protein
VSYPYRASQVFAVPLTSGLYAPERITLASLGNVPASSDALLGITILMETGGPGGSVAELWLLKNGGSPLNDAHWFYSGKSISSGAETWPLASWAGAQVRVKSGGASGNLTVHASAD